MHLVFLPLRGSVYNFFLVLQAHHVLSLNMLTFKDPVLPFFDKRSGWDRPNAKIELEEDKRMEVHVPLISYVGGKALEMTY